MRQLLLDVERIATAVRIEVDRPDLARYLERCGIEFLAADSNAHERAAHCHHDVNRLFRISLFNAIDVPQECVIVGRRLLLPLGNLVE